MFDKIVIQNNDNVYFVIRLSFRGDDKEPAVLCSASRTYEVKEAETSNTCLLLPKLKLKNHVHIEGVEGRVIEEVEVKGIFSTYLEVNSLI